MIIVSVQLLSAVDSRHDELARMEICNLGTRTATTGNYSAETLRGRSAKDFARRTRQRIAYISGHPRQREHVWNLVAKALRNLRYGGDWNAAEQVAAPIADESLKSLIGELGNQIHNLGCEHQGDEALSIRLEALRSEAWRLASIASPAACGGEVETCRHCGSVDLSWMTAQTIRPGGPLNNLLNTNDVECLFFLGCNSCSETLRTMTADDVAANMSALASNGGQSERGEA
ncbi:hypothetical protein [Sphingobium sp. YG1]|uniref:hypothetical protein n=1 Tax=Sphingobium sp. YG1 TaxID=2082188 RepID=UPI000DBB7EDB|nr:hypothetical protein [Sphingobium sp. YG1]BBC99131.1 hypothetical protein YGS_C1P0387 [Sphingobium sp. YG1]